MIETLIYWTGAVALIGFLVAAICVFSCVTLRCITSLITKDLKQTYNHVQLIYFMRQIKKKGYDQALDDVGKD